MEPSAPVAGDEAREERELWCPRCGAAVEPLQEYCLECGERLPVNQGVVGVLASGWQRRLGRYPGDWIWGALALLAVAAVATVLAVVLGARGSGGGRTLVATGESVPLGPGRLTGTVPTVTTSTAPLPTAPEPTVPESTPPPRPKPRNPNALTVWPAGKSGYTVVLESVPTTAGRALAVARAKAARAAGLRQVGVLVSSSYSSFHPGFYVVFSGVYGSFGEASTGVAAAHAHGFRDAYPRQVTR